MLCSETVCCQISAEALGIFYAALKASETGNCSCVFKNVAIVVIFYGDTIIHHYLCLKIEEAKRLLRENRLTISEISELLMFESAAYFSRIFKKFVGISPSGYRNSLIYVSAKYLESEEFLF